MNKLSSVSVKPAYILCFEGVAFNISNIYKYIVFNPYTTFKYLQMLHNIIFNPYIRFNIYKYPRLRIQPQHHIYKYLAKSHWVTVVPFIENHQHAILLFMNRWIVNISWKLNSFSLKSNYFFWALGSETKLNYFKEVYLGTTFSRKLHWKYCFQNVILCWMDFLKMQSFIFNAGCSNICSISWI